jgi:hypothetical protein
MLSNMLAILGSVAVLASLSSRKPLLLHPGTSVPGYLSDAGLPPVAGKLLVTDSSLAFRSSDGGVTIRLQRVDPSLYPPPARAKPSRLELAYVNRAVGRPSYAFRIDDGVFETRVPGELLRLAGSLVWLSRGDGQSGRDRNLRIAESPFADTLYALFGRPRASVGVVGPEGRKRMHLAQYVSGRDSVALDPESMVSEAQLRHAFAHEMAHRWASRAPRLLDSLWQGVPAIRDPHRYGYGSELEQRAEAIAFALHFLQSTMGDLDSNDDALGLLGHYESMVPGTRVLVRYLVLQPIYQRHPLRTALLVVQ